MALNPAKTMQSEKYPVLVNRYNFYAQLCKANTDTETKLEHFSRLSTQLRGGEHPRKEKTSYSCIKMGKTAHARKSQVAKPIISHCYLMSLALGWQGACALPQPAPKHCHTSACIPITGAHRVNYRGAS